MLWSAQEMSKKFRMTLGKNISPRAIHVFAEKLGYHMKRIGGKKGYDQSLYTALTRHLKELLDYDSQQAVRKPQKPQKQPKEIAWDDDNYFTYNGERDNADYEGEKNEGKIKSKKVIKEMKSCLKRIHINESQLVMLTEGNDNEKRARDYIRKSGVCDVGNPEIEDQLVHQLFNYIRNVFCSSDSKSYSYRHIQGITKLILGDGTPKSGAFKWKKGQIERDKNGLPQLDPKKLFSLRQRVERTAELEADNKMYDNSFRRLGTGAESNFNDFVDAKTLPSMSEYMQGLLSKYTEFTTPTGYHILRIPNFSTANIFSQYIPGICYLSHSNSYDKEYVGREGKLFLALKPNCSDIEKTPMGKDLFHNGGRMNEYATSTIGIAATPVENQLGRYILVTVTSRYSWTYGGTNYDYNFQELSNILGFDVLGFLHKEFPNERIALNIKGTREGNNSDIKFEQKIWKKTMF